MTSKNIVNDQLWLSTNNRIYSSNVERLSRKHLYFIASKKRLSLSHRHRNLTAEVSLLATYGLTQ